MTARRQSLCPWEFSTTPVEITKTIDGKKLKPTAILTLDSTKVNAENLAALEEILYGKDPTTQRVTMALIQDFRFPMK